MKPVLYDRHVGENGKRAFGEAFIYQIITHFENDAVIPDNAKQDDGRVAANYSKVHLTLDQKRRLRNDIARRAKQIDANNRYDPAVIESAFFETIYGKSYASHATNNDDPSGWAAHRQGYIDAISDWTTYSESRTYVPRNSTDPVTLGPATSGSDARTLISPFDPLYVDSALFEDSDSIAYVSKDVDVDANGYIKSAKLARTDASNRIRNYVVYLGWSKPGDPNKRMNGVKYLKADARNSVIESTSAGSGYDVVRKYIKDETQSKKIKDVLEKACNETIIDASGNIAKRGPISEQERLYMERACRYLTDNGIAFDVSLDNNNKLVAKTEDTHVEIRLLDREEPQYQGRLYDNGRIIRPGIENKAPANIVTATDKLNILKYWFGDTVYVDCDPKYKRGNKVIRSNLEVGDLSVLSANSSNGRNSFTCKIGEQSSALLSIRENKTNGEEVRIKMMVGSSSYGSEGTAPEIDFSDALKINKSDPFNIVPKKGSKMILSTKGLPLDKCYEEDIAILERDADGNYVYPENYVTDKLYKNISDEHLRYYQNLYIREELNVWVESARNHHSDLMALDGIIEAYRNGYDEFDSSGDEGVKELQEIYWDVLTGDMTSLSVGDIVIAENIGSLSLEDKIRAIKSHYEAYLEDYFGSVPELQKDGALDEFADNSLSKGFVPENVANYVTLDYVNGVQKNQKYILHMLSRMDEKYSSSFVKGDSYVSVNMRNSLIKAGKPVFSCTLDDLIRGGYVSGPYEKAMRNNSPEKAEAMAKFKQERPVTFDMLAHAAKTLGDSCCFSESIKVSVDDNGIITYNALTTKVLSKKKENVVEYKYGDDISDSMYKAVSGSIGQIFEPDEHGVIIPKYAEGSDKVFVPGYNAYLVEPDDAKDASMASRLRLFDWQYQMKRAISHEIRNNVFTNNTEYDFEPHTTSLNYVYKHSYDTDLLKSDYEERLPKDPANPTSEEQTFLNVITTLKNRCRFPNEYGESSTTMAQSMLEHYNRPEAKDYDYFTSDWCDNQNLRVLGRYFDGIFDPDMTGTAKTQGIVIYLADGVNINTTTGEVTPAEFEGDNVPKCALTKDPICDSMKFDTWDRRQMALSQLLTAIHTPREVNTAMMNINGWNFDDGFVVSKSFAEKYRVRGANGTTRPLTEQDKLSDLHGNKGVIAKVIDPNKTVADIAAALVLDAKEDGQLLSIDDAARTSAKIFYENETYDVTFDAASNDSHTVQAAKHIQKALGLDGLEEIMQLYKDNPDLDVVMAPYSAMSRFNGGSIRDLMRDPRPLKLGNKTLDGAMGSTNLIVVDMLADVKTHFYDEDAVKEGKGRKASGQLAWVLQARNAKHIMREFYGNNDNVINDLREYAIMTGLDFDTDMKPVIGYHAQSSRGEHRRLIKLPDESSILTQNLSLVDENGHYVSNTKAKKLDKKSVKLDAMCEKTVKDEFLSILNETGGFMELPFALKFDIKKHIRGAKFDESAFQLQPTGQTYTDGNRTYDTYGLPVLPHGLRSGRELVDGTSRQHDHTKRYIDIHRNAILYVGCDKAIDECRRRLSLIENNNTITDDKQRAEAIENLNMQISLYGAKKEECVNTAQAKFSEIVDDIVDKRFNTKHSTIRDSLMANRTSYSATAVWSANPTLKLDEVSMSSEHAKQLGLYGKDGKLIPDARVLVWRDPILHDGCVRYMKVVIDDNILGVSINPLVDKSFDGDFDGDSVAIVALKSKEARMEAYREFSLEANMLQRGVKKDGKHPLYIQDGLDVASNAYHNNEIYEKKQQLVDKINQLELTWDVIKNSEPRKLSLKNGIPNFDTPEQEYNNVNIADAKKQGLLFGEDALWALRRKYKDEMNAWAEIALDGIATDYVNFTNEKTVMESYQNMVNNGSKGSQSKLQDAANNIGIEYTIAKDDNGVTYIESAKPILNDRGEVVSRAEKDGVQRETDMAIQETAAYKADNTSLGGTTSQKGTAACRNSEHLNAMLELTYPITQAILQSKHDPKDAKIKDEIVRFWGNDIWNGYKVTGDFDITKYTPEEIQAQRHDRVTVGAVDKTGSPLMKSQKDSNGEYTPVIDAEGKPVQDVVYVKCNKEEWITQMKGMMHALKVDINPDYIKDLANVMFVEDGTSVSAQSGYANNRAVNAKACVDGFEDYAKKHGSLIDRMAYNEKYTALYQTAYDNSRPDCKSQQSLFGDILMSSMRLKLSECSLYDINHNIRNLNEKLAQASQEEAVDIQNQLKELKHQRKETSNIFYDAALQMSNSGSFAPKSYINNLVYDHIASRMENDKANGVETDEKLRHLFESLRVPKPIGRKDVLVGDINTTTDAWMGESQSDYEVRKQRVIEEQEKIAAEKAKLIEEKAKIEAVRRATESIVHDIPSDDIVRTEPTSKVSQETIDQSVAELDGSIDKSNTKNETSVDNRHNNGNSGNDGMSSL
ncbi:hypothetical protein J6A31_07375 [bacterium]|nr:hypothetical protein [bacterium]